MQLFNRHVSPRGLTVFGCEMMLVVASLAVAIQLHGPLDNPGAAIWKIALVAALCQVCFYYNDLYDLTVVHSTRELIVRLLQSAGAASILLAALYFVVPSLVIGRGIFVSSLVILLFTIIGWRVFFNVFVDARPEEQVLIVGTGAAARTVARQILAQHDFGYRIVGFISGDASMVGERIVNPAVVGTPDDIDRLIRRYQVTRIVVALSDRRGKLPIPELLHAKLSGVRVEDATTTYERLTGKILIDDLKPSWLIFSDGFRASRVTRVMKRASDLTLAVVGFLLAAPVMALVAIAVKLESTGPVLYRQERVGENNRLFTLCKFRSMRQDAETGTPIWAKEGDHRVTRVGRFIRTTRLDELPQLWNVIKGEMSFVGPRPERPFFVEQLTREIPYYQQRHAVKPGVTGWAQVKYRYGSSIEDATEKLRYDLYYIKHMSVVFDLTIVFDTVKVILFGKGAK